MYVCGGKIISVGRAVDFVRMAHEGQFDKGGFPYWTHPVRVMTLLPPNATDHMRIAALGHDLLEDTQVKVVDLISAEFSELSTTSIHWLTRDNFPAMTYMDWIEKLVKEAPLEVLYIKYADNMDNMDPRRIVYLPEDKQGIVKRYQRSMAMLKTRLTIYA